MIYDTDTHLSLLKMLIFPSADGKHHWKLANIPFNVQTKFRYAFQGIRGDPASSGGGITIDDISLTETKCPTSVWHIRNFTTLFNSTSRGDFISSPVFYSSEGYGFELRLYPHGRATSSYVNYMGITFHLCSSENDGLLEWPAGNRQVILTVLDQDPEVAQRMSLSLSFTTNPNQRVYGKSWSTGHKMEMRSFSRERCYKNWMHGQICSGGNST